ncbi:hypothetical protein Pa4123_06350 [Phytohabitans aurantiacus]|uniref:DUF5808 domain-containing protein n=1 Tax=Phytohabitans aurantiacus TaxID=3016789 RepID=A0ABQ5QL00_9ACTN|nr:hypothetical protein Pa4123_06350 [Phytohabitans aurantiacus]
MRLYGSARSIRGRDARQEHSGDRWFDWFVVNRYGDLAWEGTTSPWHLTVLGRRSRTVADIALVLLTVGLFAVLALVVRAVERL